MEPLDPKSIFANALDLPPADRGAYLDSACGGDSVLRAEVAALLDADNRAGAFLGGGGDTVRAPRAGGPGRPAPAAADTREWEATPDPYQTIATGAAGTTVPLGSGTARYRLLAELARGGMGVVWLARDLVFDRDVGLKTLLAAHGGGGLASRFREEARITAQLQHPNIPPVHDLGTLPDGRAYIAMKLIRGRTLEDELRTRPNPAHDAGRFLAVFESVTQGVAYAHSSGVIHRDLKPSNVMVGAFGEVQVMDWGLAKVLPHVPPESPSPAGEPRSAVTTERLGGDATHAGSVLGTPAYMPPEQAVGAVDQMDACSDVFGLGGILCVILTGKPPYSGPDSEATRRLAAGARLDDCFARLGACCAAPELVALAKRCLAADRGARPRDAGEVAATVATIRAEAEQRARRAEVERERAEVRVAEQRKRRKVQLALVTVVALLATGAGAFAWWDDRKATDRELAAGRAESERLRHEADEAVLRGQRDAEAEAKTREAEAKAEQARRGATDNLALAAELRKQFKFNEAGRALALALELANRGAPELRGRVDRAKRDLVLAAQLDDIRYRKWRWIRHAGEEGHFNTAPAPAQYRAAFAADGLDLSALDPTTASARIASSDVRAELVAAVDDWALFEPDAALRDRLLEINRRADPDPWRDRLRTAATWADRWAVSKLAHDIESDPGAQPPAALSALSELVVRSQMDPAAFMWAARAKYPTDFELAFTLARRIIEHDNYTLRALGPLEAARAIRPDNVSVLFNLTQTFHELGELDAAIWLGTELVRLDPESGESHGVLGAALAARARREANAARTRADRERAAAECRAAIRLDPDTLDWPLNLGILLHDAGDFNGSVAACQQILERHPKYAPARTHLGAALMAQNKVDAAIGAYKRAISDDPKYALAHYNLGVALTSKNRLPEALAAYKEAIKRDPNLELAHANLGVVLARLDKPGEAIEAYKRATELDPKDVIAQYNLANLLKRSGRVDEAIDRYGRAMEANPTLPDSYCNLGMLYRQLGQPDKALPLLRQGHQLGIGRPGWNYPSARWVADCERELAALRDRTAPPPHEVTRP